LDPDATYAVEYNIRIRPRSDAELWVQAIAMYLSIIVGMITFTGSIIACLKLNGNIASKPNVLPFRLWFTAGLFTAIVVLAVLTFNGGQDWNDRSAGITFVVIVALLSGEFCVSSLSAQPPPERTVIIARSCRPLLQVYMECRA
jgi:NAD/NADP transhydrogenase beta subunit